MRRMRTCVAIVLSLLAVSVAGEEECRLEDRYRAGLCLYAQGDYRGALELFESVSEGRDDRGAKAAYFLARVHMKLGEWEDASRVLTRIFERSPAFYRLWNCDFLLGVCREMLERG